MERSRCWHSGSRSPSARLREGEREPLLTLGSAPLDIVEFRGVVLGQLGEPRLIAAIESDIAGPNSHARALDADAFGALKDIHRRVATTILFESSGGQSDKAAHLPELRFALGEPDVDTTSIDTAALALENRAFFIRRIGSDGFQVRHQPTLRKVVSDRRASLDEERDVKPAMRNTVKKEFEKGAKLPISLFPEDGAAVSDSPRLTHVIMDPEYEWTGTGPLRERISEWTRQRGTSPRLYPGALIWCFRKPGRELRDKVELSLAWKKVHNEVMEGTLGSDFDKAERVDIQARVADAEETAREEVWADYRYVVLSDNREPDGLKVIDLGAGHSSSTETLTSRVISAMKSQALLNDSPGAGYLERKWPPALKDSGAWPLASLRQAFLTGAMERLLEPDAYLRARIPDFVLKGDFGLASGLRPDGTYERVWFEELLSPDEVAFDPGVFLLRKDKASALKSGAIPGLSSASLPRSVHEPPPPLTPPAGSTEPEPGSSKRTLRIFGAPSPPRSGIGWAPSSCRSSAAGTDLRVGVDFTVMFEEPAAKALESDLRQILDELGLTGKVRIE